MALAIAGMAKLLGQLTILIPATDSLVRGLSEAVVKVRRNPSAEQRIEELEKAIRLQVDVNERLNDQLRIVQSVLTNVQRLLKALVYFTMAGATVAVVALAATFFR